LISKDIRKIVQGQLRQSRGTVPPWPLSSVADVLPFTEFIRAFRIALIPGTPGSYFYYLGLSFLGGLLFLGIGLVAYRLAEERARRLGVVDRKAV